MAVLTFDSLPSSRAISRSMARLTSLLVATQLSSSPTHVPPTAGARYDARCDRCSTLSKACGGGEVANAREQYLQALSSLTETTKSRAERLAGLLAKQGELQSGQVGRFAEDLVRRTRRNRETVGRLIQREVKRQLGGLGIATKDEVARLQQRVRALEQAAERPAASRAAPRGRAAAGSGSRTTTRRTSTRGAAAASGGTPSGGTPSGGGRRASAGSRGASRGASTESSPPSPPSPAEPGATGAEQDTSQSE